MTGLLNEMLERLHGSVQANQRFAADARQVGGVERGRCQLALGVR